jgi:deoxyribonuclease I
MGLDSTISVHRRRATGTLNQRGVVSRSVATTSSVSAQVSNTDHLDLVKAPLKDNPFTSDSRRVVQAHAGEGTKPHRLRARVGKPVHLSQNSADKAILKRLRAQGSERVFLSYKNARKHLFGHIDNDSGVVRGVYSDLEIVTKKIPRAAGSRGMNTEHTWPKSHGLDSYGISDLHHLFPTSSHVNSRRSDLPFGKVADIHWQGEGAKMGLDTSGKMVFEPPTEHKGNVARAIFYVSAIYDLRLEDSQEAILRTWHLQDPVDQEEKRRNASVASVQGNRNPFIDDPLLVGRISDF